MRWLLWLIKWVVGWPGTPPEGPGARPRWPDTFTKCPHCGHSAEGNVRNRRTECGKRIDPRKMAG